MLLLDWYMHKADQCARLAKEARNPETRSKFQDERQEWLRLAEQALLGKPPTMLQ